jgi:diguanylate cyclase (GGDEF)-like protein
VAERHHWTLAVMFLDLDRFKNVNDAFGHAAGDEVLIEVARRLALHTRDEDTACRNGGDEFLFLLMNPQGRENIARIADMILKTTAAPLDTGRLDIVIKASIGIAVYPDNGTTGDELIKNADSAMYKAKELKSGYVFC